MAVASTMLTVPVVAPKLRADEGDRVPLEVSGLRRLIRPSCRWP